MRIAPFVTLLAAVATPLAHAGQVSGSGLVNGSFETVNVPITGLTSSNNGYEITAAGNVPGWRTTASDNRVEVWDYSPSQTGAIAAADGSRFAELNANMVSTLFQDVSGYAAGTVLGWQLAHRGRAGDDTMRLTITDLGVDNSFGSADDRVLFTALFTDGNAAWGYYSGSGVIASANAMRFSFESVSAAGGSNSVGNFIDAAAFGVGIGTPRSGAQAVPEPASWLLSGTALIAALALLLRRRRAAAD